MAGCFALGVLVATLASRAGWFGGFIPETEVPGIPATPSNDQVTLINEYERKISDLTLSLQSVQGQLSADQTGDSVHPSRPMQDTSQGFRKFTEEMAAQGKANALQRETDRLLAAGFSLQRIDWLRSRTEELRVERERLAHEGAIGDANLALAYVVDPDLDLRNEIGEDEYDRYRQGLGRPTGITVQQVLQGSSLVGADLRPGDVIIGYAGKRVYNEAMLNASVSGNRLSGSTTMDVLREGQKLQLVVPSGPLGLQNESPSMSRLKSRLMQIEAGPSGL